MTEGNKMEQITTNQRTFGKATKKLIKDLIPSATSCKKIFSSYKKNYLIKNEEGKTIATWSQRSMQNGLLVIF
jgi:hypothetical protein